MHRISSEKFFVRKYFVRFFLVFGPNLADFGRKTHFFVFFSDEKLYTSDEKPTFSDEKHSTSDEKHFTSDQKHPTSDQKLLFSDEKYFTSDQKPFFSDEKQTSSDEKLRCVTFFYPDHQDVKLGLG